MTLPKYGSINIYVGELKQSQNSRASLQADVEHQVLYSFTPSIVPLHSLDYMKFVPVHSFVRENVHSDICFKLLQVYSKSTSGFFASWNTVL